MTDHNAFKIYKKSSASLFGIDYGKCLIFYVAQSN